MSFTEKYVSSLASGGGSGDSEGDPWTIDEAAAGVVPGTWVNVKDDGIYNRPLGSALQLSVHGSDAAPIVWEGYLTTPHDKASRFRIRGTGLQFQYNMAILANHNHVIRADCEKSDLNDVFVVGNSARGFCVVDCVFNNTSGGAAGAASTSNTTQGAFIGNYLRTAGSKPCFTSSPSGSPVMFCRNVCLSAGALAANSSAVTLSIYRNHVISDNLIIVKGTNAGTACVRITAPAWSQMDIHHITGNTLVGGQYGVYVNATTGQSARSAACLFVANNLISSLTAGVANGGAALYPTGLAVYGNAVYAPTAFDVGDIPTNDNIILSSDPFVDAVGGDYTLNDVAGGGAAVKGASFPRSQFISTGSTYRSIGAFEFEPATGGGGVSFVPHPLGRF